MKKFFKNVGKYGLGATLSVAATNALAVQNEIDPTAAGTAVENAANAGISTGQYVILGVAALTAISIIVMVVKKV